MTVQRVALLFLAVLIFGECLLADEVIDASSNRKVGSVFGRTIKAKEIDLLAPFIPHGPIGFANRGRWHQMERVRTVFGEPVLQRFAKEHGIEVTANDVKQFRSDFRRKREQVLRQAEAKLARTKEKLASDNLSDVDKAKLSVGREVDERHVATLRDELVHEVSEDTARRLIFSWKVERALYRQYGGRVVFRGSGAGPLALDARLQLFGEAEKAEILMFDEPGVRYLFYHYYSIYGDDDAIDSKRIERQWYLERPWFELIVHRHISKNVRRPFLPRR